VLAAVANPEPHGSLFFRPPCRNGPTARGRTDGEHPDGYNGDPEDRAMPLRDHFRPPLDDIASWEEFHGAWPTVIVMALNRKLPPRYVAGPRVHLGAAMEIDVSAYDQDEPAAFGRTTGEGGVATAAWARRPVANSTAFKASRSSGFAVATSIVPWSRRTGTTSYFVAIESLRARAT